MGTQTSLFDIDQAAPRVVPLPTPPAGVTLEDAVLYLQANAEAGVDCPCCGKYVKAYRRRLNKTMGRALAWLFQQSADYWAVKIDRTPWVDVPRVAPRWLLKTNQHTSLAWWGLAVRRGGSAAADKQADRVDDKKSSGQWAITYKGYQFLNGSVQVPEAVYTFNGKPYGFDDTLISFDEIGGVPTYSEIMEDVRGYREASKISADQSVAPWLLTGKTPNAPEGNET